MQGVYSQNYTISDIHVDCWNRLRPSMILMLTQEVAGVHFRQISMSYDALEKMGLFWAVTRHKVQITRLPRLGETIRVETWPMPTTRVTYPRSVVAYDEGGNELFRAITLWVLMDIQKRAMVLPGQSGVDISGTLRGLELASPLGLPARILGNGQRRRVSFSDLDRNLHMNNTRYLDWLADLLPSAFHREHPVKEFTVCYLTEAREGETLDLSWEMGEDGQLQMQASRPGADKPERVFAAKIGF